MNQVILFGISGKMYTLREKIGEGSYGKVYATQNAGLVAKIQLKDEGYHEANVIQELSGIKGVLKIIDKGPIISFDANKIGVSEDSKFMIFERLGPSLHNIRLDYPLVTKSDALKVGIKLIDCVQKIHEAGYVHRDIKVDNLLTTLNWEEDP